MNHESEKVHAKKQNAQRKGSDRKRIKNITNEIHPEYAQKKNRSKMHKEEMQRERAARRRSIERRKRMKRKKQIMNLFRFLFIIVIVVALGFIINKVRSFNSGQRYDEKGMIAYENGDYEQAVTQFKEAVSYDSQNAEYYIHLGMAYIEQNAYAEARGYFNQAETCADTDLENTLLNRGRGIACLYEGKYIEAKTAFTAAASFEEMDTELKVDILYYKAEAEQKAGDNASAVQTYSEIIQTSEDASAYLMRGIVYESIENYAEAEKDLYTAIDKSKKSYMIYRTLYRALNKQGKTDEAKAVLNEALKLSGKSGEDYFNRGMIYLDLEDYEQAGEMFTASLDKNYTFASLGFGDLMLRKKDYKTALSYYEAFFETIDEKKMEPYMLATACNQYAYCLMENGQFEKAVEICKQGLAYNQRDLDASLSFNLITAYENLMQWENAYNLAKTYVEKYPEDAAGQKEFTFLESRVMQ